MPQQLCEDKRKERRRKRQTEECQIQRRRRTKSWGLYRQTQSLRFDLSYSFLREIVRSLNSCCNSLWGLNAKTISVRFMYWCLLSNKSLLSFPTFRRKSSCAVLPVTTSSLQETSCSTTWRRAATPPLSLQTSLTSLWVRAKRTRRRTDSTPRSQQGLGSLWPKEDFSGLNDWELICKPLPEMSANICIDELVQNSPLTPVVGLSWRALWWYYWIVKS